MAMLLGKKVGMTQVYDEQERLLPVTVIQAGPCVVTQVKTVETDGYNALQLGFDDAKASRRTKAAIGHAEKAKTTPKRFVREMRLAANAKPELNTGDSITVATFADTKFVDVKAIPFRRYARLARDGAKASFAGLAGRLWNRPWSRRRHKEGQKNGGTHGGRESNSQDTSACFNRPGE